MPKKSNAARLLDEMGIAYKLLEYEVDEEDLSASHLAKSCGLDLDKVFKTIVLEGNKNGYFVCLLPSDKELDLKKAAQASDNKNCQLVAIKELLNITGYMRGGCSPIGMKKEFPTYIDESILYHDEVIVNAGKRGLQFRIAPEDIIKAAKGSLKDLVQELKYNDENPY